MEYKSCKISEFVFKNGNFVSIYGQAGSGKTIVALQLLENIYPSLYISTEGKEYQARASRMLLTESYFLEVNNDADLIQAILNASRLELKLIIVDTINIFYRLERKEKTLIVPLMLLKEFSKLGRVVTIWQMSLNNKVSGEKFMRYFSDDILRMTKNYIIGNMRECKFKITERGVIGCLKNSC
ncbi:AAA family ATPase [Acidianus manzaensis]|uniref:AAA family ATPase n=1 Tax=Acidianus manzaensis TaxID=282676 RepID=A0A1W6JZP7_9CREN|nr:AAA family ATPase [Acidianus manzaensis]ARM75690.1 AAA family ATPase [Acidianus manzaensis]